MPILRSLPPNSTNSRGLFNACTQQGSSGVKFKQRLTDTPQRARSFSLTMLKAATTSSIVCKPSCSASHKWTTKSTSWNNWTKVLSISWHPCTSSRKSSSIDRGTNSLRLSWPNLKDSSRISQMKSQQLLRKDQSPSSRISWKLRVKMRLGYSTRAWRCNY